MPAAVCCIICFMPVFSFHLSALRCGHTYHLHCIMKWLKKNVNCPICRERVLIRDAIKPSFLRTREDDLYSRYSPAIRNTLQECQRMQPLRKSEINAASLSDGIKLYSLLQKIYEFELSSLTWIKPRVCPSCLKHFRETNTRASRCGHTVHSACFEKWKKISEKCQVCHRISALKSIDDDLLTVLSKNNYGPHEYDLTESKNQELDEAERLRQENALSHLKILEATRILENAFKLW